MLEILELLCSGILIFFSDHLLMMEGKPKGFFKLRFMLALLTYFFLVLAICLLLAVSFFIAYHGWGEKNWSLLLPAGLVVLVIGLGLPWFWKVSKHILDLVKSVLKGDGLDD